MTNLYEQSNDLRKETGECIFVSFKRHMIAISPRITENYSKGTGYSVSTEELDEIVKEQSEERYSKLLLFTERFRGIHDNDLSTHDKLLLLDRLCQVLMLRGAYYEDGHYFYKGNRYSTKETLIQSLFPEVEFKPSLLRKEATAITLESLQYGATHFMYLSKEQTACVIDNTALVAKSKETYENLTGFLSEFPLSGYITEDGYEIKWSITDPEAFVNIKTAEGTVRVLKSLIESGVSSIFKEDSESNNPIRVKTLSYPVAKFSDNDFAFKYEE